MSDFWQFLICEWLTSHRYMFTVFIVVSMTVFLKDDLKWFAFALPNMCNV